MRRVVITGLGIISPVGNNIPDYFENLCQGVCGIGPITHFDTEGYKVHLAAEVKDFNPADYGLENTRRMDLYTQYAMAAAKQAAEDSGIVGAVEPDRLGVYVGSGIGGIHTFAAETEKLLNRGPGRVSPLFIPMMIANIAAGNIAMAMDAQGPCLPVVTACATSTHTIGEAFHAIAHGYADAIFAGGSEAAVEPLAIAGFTSCQALSLSEDADAASLPFDARRKGFVIGEGAGILVLEEYEHAKARGAKIYAEICGYGNTCDAHHITAPDPEATQSARAIRIAKEESGIQGGEGVYINAHGTGTPLNDKTETLAIKKAFGESEAKKIKVSSTKSMTGHMLGAAGAMEAFVSVMALREGIIPPTINYLEPDPECDLFVTPNKAVKADIKYALSSSLGFGGHNACVAFKKA